MIQSLAPSSWLGGARRWLVSFLISVDSLISIISLKWPGPLSIAVPGEIKGLHAAWKKYGKLPWRDLIEPTINMTEYGFQIQLRLYESMQNFRYIIEEDEGLM